jgi:hypothetical protein
MEPPSILDRLLQEIEHSRGYNPKAAYQGFIETGPTRRSLTDEYKIVDPVKPQAMVVPKVLPAGVRSPSARGTPAKIEPIKGRLTLEDFDLTEADLVPGRANKAGRTTKPMKKEELSNIARQIKQHEKAQGGIQHFHSIPSTRAPLVAALRKYFGLAPSEDEEEETAEKKTRKRR